MRVDECYNVSQDNYPALAQCSFPPFSLLGLVDANLPNNHLNLQPTVDSVGWKDSTLWKVTIIRAYIQLGGTMIDTPA